MNIRDRLLIIAMVIAAPLLVTAAGVSASAGLLVGIALVAGGLAWTLLSGRDS